MMATRTKRRKAKDNWVAAISAAQCDFMLNYDCVPPIKSYTYACNTSDLVYGYIFKIPDLNIPTSDSHQCRNALKRFCKRDTNGGVFVIYGCGAWFSIADIYETTNHTNSYFQVAFNNLSSIKIFDKTRMTPRSVFFNNFIAALRDYKYAGRTPEALDECTCLKLLNYIINHMDDIRRHINIFKRVENKGFGFIAQQVMDAVLEYAKVPITIQSYAKAQSYTNVSGTTSETKDTRRVCSRDSAAATSSTSEEVYGLKTNDDGNFMLDGKFYPLKAFVLEEIYLGKLSKFSWGSCRDKRWGNHSIRMGKTRTGGRKKKTSET